MHAVFNYLLTEIITVRLVGSSVALKVNMVLKNLVLYETITRVAERGLGLKNYPALLSKLLLFRLCLILNI